MFASDPVLALGSGGSFRTMPSRHAQTNVEVIQESVDVGVTVTRAERDVVRVDIKKR